MFSYDCPWLVKIIVFSLSVADKESKSKIKLLTILKKYSKLKHADPSQADVCQGGKFALSLMTLMISETL